MNIWASWIRKIGGLWFVFWVGLSCQMVWGSESQVPEELLTQMELEEVERLVSELTKDKLSFFELLEHLMETGQPMDKESVKNIAGELLQEAFGIQKEVCIQILLLLLLASFFANLSSAFKNPQIEEMSFYMCYVILFLLILRQVNAFGDKIQGAVQGICDFMEVLLPSYYLVIVASTGTSTALAFYQMIIGVIYLCEKIVLNLLIPGVRLYLLISLVNHLTRDDWMSRMTDLTKNVILWTAKTMLGILFGMQVIQRMVSPAVDSFKRTILGKTTGTIPIVGDIFQGVTEVVLGSAILIKNCVGVAAICFMIFVGAVPLLSLAIHGLGYQLIAGIFQPVGEPRLISCVHLMGETIFMLFRLLFTVEIMFLLTIAMLAGTFG